eukprot:859208-Rhodomonas_salina.2
MVPCDVWCRAMSGTEHAISGCVLLRERMVLRVYYAMRGTELGYGATASSQRKTTSSRHCSSRPGECKSNAKSCSLRTVCTAAAVFSLLFRTARQCERPNPRPLPYAIAMRYSELRERISIGSCYAFSLY